MERKSFVSVVLVSLLFCNVDAILQLNRDSDRYPINRRVHSDALDAGLCQLQLEYLTRDSLLSARFLDAGIRVPRGIMEGNTQDFGNFHQCLAINEEADDMVISGKYCQIQVPMNQELRLTNFLERSKWKFNPHELQVDEKVLRRVEKINFMRKALKSGIHGTDVFERLESDGLLADLVFQLAICIPRPCSTAEGINGLLFNLTEVGFEYSDIICRLPDDKPWVAADYVAIVVFSVIAALTLISTGYDLYQSLHLKKGPKEISKLYSSFSVYTNARSILTFSSNPGALECLDGVRALATVWVVLLHTYSTVAATVNPVDRSMWSLSLQSIWVSSGHVAVDTFFFLSGLLLVYTSVGKLGSIQLLKNLHIFYLNRLLRLLPVLAAAILFEASFFMRMADGPMWDTVALHAFKCREVWWATLLHIQNIVIPREAYFTIILLLCSLSMLLVVLYCIQLPDSLEWDNQTADNLFNSFLRPLWALSLGWLIFACIQGRAEPINWFLSLRIWKLPARLSYAMYLTHYTLMVGYYSSRVAPTYFSVASIFFYFVTFISITLVVSFFVTLLIDWPFSIIFRMFLPSYKQQKSTEPAVKGIVKDNGNDLASNGIRTDEDNKTLEPLSSNEELKLNINQDTENTLSVNENARNVENNKL